MNKIEHFAEPRRLWLSWQGPEGTIRRQRRVVAEIVREDDQVVFRYLDQTPDYRAAKEEGFDGYPAFNRATPEHRSGVLDAFMRRLPPRKRKDFAEFLEKYRLPSNYTGSDMALLGYTGARLPGDGFELCPDFASAPLPLQLIIEVAGFRHQSVPVSALREGDAVRFAPESDNAFDSQAVSICHKHGRIGYVPAPMTVPVREWLRKATLTAVIDRLNGQPERPLVYVFVSVSPRQ